MKEKFNKETAKKVAFYVTCGVAGFVVGRTIASYGVLAAYADIARRGYHIADEAGNIVKMIEVYNK